MQFKSYFTILFLIFAVGCSDSSVQIQSIHGRTMGTSYSISWPATASVDAQGIQSRVDLALVEVNRQMSTYDAQSEISQFNQAHAPHEMNISDGFATVLLAAAELNRLSDGYFDPTVGPLVNLWGFGPDRRPNKVPTQEQVAETMSNVGWSGVKLSSGVLSKSVDRYVDLSAIAKGYGVDVVASLLEEHGIHSYLVEIGGEIRSKGVKALGQPWRIAIESPQYDARQAQKIIALGDMGVATSGDYRNYYVVDGQAFSHTIDPFTGYPSRHTLASVTVVDDTCMRADGLATAMLVMGAEKAAQLAEKEGLAAFFIVRQADGKFVESTSTAWTRLFH